MPFYDTTNGPVVLYIPPADTGSITGSFDDAWQGALADVGPAGIDGGSGGRYLILPPDHAGEVPDGYLPLSSPTYWGYALLRSNLHGGSEEDIAAAVAYGKRVGFHPLSVGEEADTTFVDAADVVFDAAIPYDAAFFEALNRRVQAEPWLTRDKAMIDQLKTVGIEKGRTFSPDETARRNLAEAMAEVRAWLDDRYEQLFATTFYDDARWAFPASTDLVEAITTGFANPDAYPVDDRAVTYSWAFFSLKKVGAGQFYLMTITDADGVPLDGNETYRLTVPAEVPVTLYWSLTAYSRRSHTLIRDVPWASRSSNTPDLRTNADGSVDLYFGPAPPDGRRPNWVPTRAGERFEVLCRLYGPEHRFFDKTWKLPDMHRST